MVSHAALKAITKLLIKRCFTDPTFFPGHAASIHCILDGKTSVVGNFGVLHPTVLRNFELPMPVSALEINLEAFL
jgi:phenylalanyl-tRNA synthetase beta chain